MLAFEILELQTDRARCADFRSRNGIVVENLQKKNRILAFAQSEPAEVPLVLIAQDGTLRFFFLQSGFVFAIADLDDQRDFGNTEIIARAVFERQDFVAVNLQIFGRLQ